jgi:uncharacterized membrane protein YccC
MSRLSEVAKKRIVNVRFTLVGLIGAVTLCAILFAALRSGSNDWFKSVYTLTFITLLYAAIAARYRDAFWYGFSIVGWAYFLIGFGNWIGSGLGHETTNRHVVSAVILEAISGTMGLGDQPPIGAAALSNQIMELRRQNREGICHSALTIIFAIVGGIVAQRMATFLARTQPMEPTPRNPLTTDNSHEAR